jgi:hypothetical protein
VLVFDSSLIRKSAFSISRRNGKIRFYEVVVTHSPMLQLPVIGNATGLKVTALYPVDHLHLETRCSFCCPTEPATKRGAYLDFVRWIHQLLSRARDFA